MYIILHKVLMHVGAIRKLLYVFCVCAGDNPLAKACRLSSCIDAQTIHCIMTLAHFYDLCCSLIWTRPCLFEGRSFKLYSFFSLNLEAIEDISPKKTQFQNFFPRQVVITNALNIYIKVCLDCQNRQNDACRIQIYCHRQNV